MEVRYTELQVEWGLTDEEFDNIDSVKMQRLLEYRQAKAEGETIASKKK